MKLAEYLPTLRWVLLQAVVEEKTKGGIYIPSSVLSNPTRFKVIWVGEEVEGDLASGDEVKLDPRVSPYSIMLQNESGVEVEYFTLQDMNIIGRARSK